MFHGDEPLGRGPEDDRLVTAPAVRVGVRNGLGRQQGLTIAEQFQDRSVGIEDAHALDVRSAGHEPPSAVYRAVDIQTVGLPQGIVFMAVSGSRVHASGTLLQGDMLAQQTRRAAVQEGVSGHEVGQPPALHGGQGPSGLESAALGRGCHQFGGDQVDLVSDLHRRILQIGVEGDGQVGGQRPGGGRPDHHRHPPASESRIQQGGIRRQGKLDVDGGAGVVLVFDLCFRQSRAAGAAPVHGFQSLVDISLAHELAEGAGDGGLVAVAHGEVGCVPIPEDAQSNELPFLQLHELAGVLPAFAANLDTGHAGLFPAEHLVDLDLDRQSVTVPSGDVGRVETRHGSRLDDEVLENLVFGMSDMDVAVGVGRSVVQEEHRTSGSEVADLPVQLQLVPPLQYARFQVGKAGLHRKAGSGQIDGVLQFHGDESGGGTPAAGLGSPHFSPGDMVMAQEFSLQRVLASEERSGHYGRGSLCALKGKGQARACPAPSVTCKPSTWSQARLLKINCSCSASGDLVRSAG